MPCTIDRLIGRRVWDSRGRPTVEVEMHSSAGHIGRSSAPAGASRGSNEAVDLRDGGPEFGGWGVNRAVANVNGPISRALAGMDATDQSSIDQVLIEIDGTPDKASLGGNATIATSMAALQLAAASQGLPLWRYLAQGTQVSLPLPEIQVFGGGAHAGKRLDIQDLMVVPIGARSFDEALVMAAEVYRIAGETMADMHRLAGVADEGGWWPLFDSNEEALEVLTRCIEKAGYGKGQVGISLDIAASQLGSNGRYRTNLDDREYERDEWLEVLLGWVRRYPILSVEDPFAEDDLAGMQAFTAAVGDRIQVIGDDFLVTNAQRIISAAQQNACNAVLLKPNQAGTITEMLNALQAARDVGFGTIISARSGETEDVAIVHLAVGWNIGHLKVGSFARSERMAKWNEGLRIEEALGAGARFAGCSALPVKISSPE
ncbi:MAG TPA: phosphopyruvate hydratase [Bryobacteraceae bacterium]|nr:phosphopyruvate hydratase [Bryobacteraceae bacterium]